MSFKDGGGFICLFSPHAGAPAQPLGGHHKEAGSSNKLLPALRWDFFKLEHSRPLLGGFHEPMGHQSLLELAALPLSTEEKPVATFFTPLTVTAEWSPGDCSSPHLAQPALSPQEQWPHFLISPKFLSSDIVLPC